VVLYLLLRDLKRKRAGVPLVATQWLVRIASPVSLTWCAASLLACSPLEDSEEEGEEFGYVVQRPPPELMGLRELELRAQSTVLAGAVSKWH
jgi:hypothetical protein